MSNNSTPSSTPSSSASTNGSLETVPTAKAYAAHGTIPNTPLVASFISFTLGIIFTLGSLLFLSGGIQGLWWARYQLGFFVGSWAAFHWGEFAVTAGWNREKCTVDSFLLNNGRAYHIANSAAVVEFLVTVYFAPQLKTYSYITLTGIFVTIAGQVLRSVAMIQASTNFSHAVALYKTQTHQLVTHGVYAYFRHPSYAGFFYWSLGTQLTLQNPVSFIAFSVVLWRFFFFRLRNEERALVRFFPKDYEAYRKRVGTKIPFIP